jgi:hypothetical protein
MSKLILNDVTNIDSLTTINSNFDRIEQALQEKILFRDNPEGEPNTMLNSLDMNGKDILNARTLTLQSGPVASISQVAEALDSVQTTASIVQDNLTLTTLYKDAAQQSATSAAASYDLFDDRFLGAKTFDPPTDNDGNTLIAGSMYFALQLSPSRMRVYSGTAWQDVGSFTSANVSTVDPSLYASTLEAQQGINTLKVMTPARTFEAIQNRLDTPTVNTLNVVDGDFSLSLNSNVAKINMGWPDAYIQFDRNTNTYSFKINAVTFATIGTSGGLQIPFDGNLSDSVVRRSQMYTAIGPAFFPGDVKDSYRTTDHGKWLLITRSYRTIGDALSGATARANADTYALYNELWSNVGVGVLGIQDQSGAASTAGASSLADFNAHKRLILPNHSGLITKGHHGGDASYTTNTSRGLGSVEYDDNKNHAHSYWSSTESADGTAPDVERLGGWRQLAYSTSYQGGNEVTVRNRSTNVFIAF